MYEESDSDLLFVIVRGDQVRALIPILDRGIRKPRFGGDDASLGVFYASHPEHAARERPMEPGLRAERPDRIPYEQNVESSTRSKNMRSLDRRLVEPSAPFAMQSQALCQGSGAHRVRSLRRLTAREKGQQE